MLWPTFGRPRNLDRTQQNDFGDHLDAVAALMNKAGGEDYARARISEYMKRMHGETSGPWVLPDAPVAARRPPPARKPRRQSPSKPAADKDSGSLLDEALASDDFGMDDEGRSEQPAGKTTNASSAAPPIPSQASGGDDLPENDAPIENSPEVFPDEAPDDQKEDR
jgi:hypothetical protein